ncbi:MAG: serine/threonine-protein kinase, partial [Myxococcota bacterium]
MPSTRTITVGSILDQRFEIEAVLGRGGFATVYQACQLNMGRSVALKVLDIRPNRSEEEVERLCEHFFQEACNTAAVVHPDIVNVFDYGVTHDGRPYIVLELLKGHTLEEELRTYGAMAPTRALPLFIRCLDALQTAHDKRIVHKDLKPSNLFITNRKSTAETLRLIDFGIATLLDDEEHPTPTGQYVGTAAYCAPEHYEHNLITPALDVYQMGLCLAETLMGGPVVTGPNAIRIIAQHCTGDLKLPWKLLHGPLRTIFQRALANDPKQRYTDAAELRDALSTIDPKQLEPMSIDAIHKRVTLSSLHSPTLISITQDDFGGADHVLAQFNSQTDPGQHTDDTQDSRADASRFNIKPNTPDIAMAPTLDTLPNQGLFAPSTATHPSPTHTTTTRTPIVAPSEVATVLWTGRRGMCGGGGGEQPLVRKGVEG